MTRTSIGAALPLVTTPIGADIDRDPRAIEARYRDGSGLEILDRTACLRLLATATLGRVGITNEALPMIIPVTFRLVGSRIVFRTGLGTTLDNATRDAVVAFEVDHLDPRTGAGWSVSVTGVARELTAADDGWAMALTEIPPWTTTGGDHFVAVSTEKISGRRIPVDRRS